jgi:hypothetical protein
MTTSTPDDTAAQQGSAQAVEDPEAVLRTLAASVALLPQSPRQEGDPEMPEGAIALPVIEQDGRQFIPVFTSEDALQAAGADLDSALRIPIAELAASWPSDDLWLAVNPSSEQGLALPPDLVRALPVFAGAGGVSMGGAGDAGTAATGSDQPPP